jgi:hypothetical protein
MNAAGVIWGGSLKVLYIGAIGRSGSTLINRLLGQLPGVCPIGELVYVWQRGVIEDDRCGCGEPFHRCPFWQAVLAAAFNGSGNTHATRVAELRTAVDRARFIPWLLEPSVRPGFRRMVDEYVDYCVKLYAAVRDVSGCEVIADSSKNPSFAFCLRLSKDLDLRVVHVVRDSRAVAHSWTRKVRNSDVAARTYMPTIAPARTAGQWNYHNGALHMLAGAGVPIMRVRYEDVVSRPDEAVSEIAQFAGLPVGNGQLGFMGSDEDGRWADLSIAHIPSGNPMRFRAGRTPIRMDDEWRTAMSPTDRRTVTALTLPLLRHYGYLGQRSRR